MSTEARSEIAKLWDAYPTISEHPTRSNVRLARHPNGPVVIFGDDMDHMATPYGYILHIQSEGTEPNDVAHDAHWIALACYRALGG